MSCNAVPSTPRAAKRRVDAAIVAARTSVSAAREATIWLVCAYHVGNNRASAGRGELEGSRRSLEQEEAPRPLLDAFRDRSPDATCCTDRWSQKRREHPSLRPPCRAP